MEEVRPGWKIRELTTERGIYQHGRLNKADPKFGYALEDQARALMVAEELGEKNLAGIYLGFIKDAFKDGEWHQFFYEDKRGWERGCSDDALAYVLWALTRVGQEKSLIDDLTKRVKNSIWPRTMAMGILALKDEGMKEKLIKLYKKNSSKEWPWFEGSLVYGNALMPWALWEIGELRLARESTDFLVRTCQIDGVPAPIGCKGWYKKGGKKAVYDQQPVDASYMVQMLARAYEMSGDNKYLNEAKNWWQWFEGNNIKRVNLVDKNGACYDAVTEDGVNLNQGAESNVCYLMAYLTVRKLGLVD